MVLYQDLLRTRSKARGYRVPVARIDTGMAREKGVRKKKFDACSGRCQGAGLAGLTVRIRGWVGMQTSWRAIVDDAEMRREIRGLGDEPQSSG